MKLIVLEFLQTTHFAGMSYKKNQTAGFSEHAANRLLKARNALGPIVKKVGETVKDPVTLGGVVPVDQMEQRKAISAGEIEGQADYMKAEPETAPPEKPKRRRGRPRKNKE